MKSFPSLPFFSVCLLLMIWSMAAWLGDATVLPAPPIVFDRILGEAQSGDLFYHCAVTLLRVACAFMIALLVGSSIGIAMGLYRKTDQFFDPWLIFFLNIPALVVIVLCYIWIGLGEVAAILAVMINKIPNVVVTMREGTRALDPKLLEMAKIYRIGRLQKLRYVILPQLTPYFFAAARSGLALIWKIVLVVELLGRSNGVGFQLHLFFQLFDVAGILAYSLMFVFIIFLIENFILKPLDHRLHGWRTS